MFHMEHFSLFLCAATALSVGNAEVLASEMLPPQWEDSLVAAASSCSNEEGRTLTARGWQALLMGDDDLARTQFEVALARDEQALMARCGLLLLGDASQRELIESSLESAGLNPSEVFSENISLGDGSDSWMAATNTTVQYAAMLSPETGKLELARHMHFTGFSGMFRADFFAGYWGIVLSHYCGQEAAARELCQSLLEREPQNPMLLFLRALSEEQESAVSVKALQAAKRCTELLCTEAMPFQLYGHLLFRSGRVEESVEVFESARQKADGTLFYAASLYKATALWCLHRDQESLDLRRELNASIVLAKAPQSDAERLWRWEVNTLPLRVLVLRKELPTGTEIRLAVKAATLEAKWEEDAVVLLYRDALAAVLYARLKKDARQLNKAEECYKRFLAMGAGDAAPMSKSCYLRAKAALEIALNAARAELFSEQTKDIWTSNKEELLQQPTSRLLPPPIPDRGSVGACRSTHLRPRLGECWRGAVSRFSLSCSGAGHFID